MSGLLQLLRPAQPDFPSANLMNHAAEDLVAARFRLAAEPREGWPELLAAAVAIVLVIAVSVATIPAC